MCQECLEGEERYKGCKEMTSHSEPTVSALTKSSRYTPLILEKDESFCAGLENPKCVADNKSDYFNGKLTVEKSENTGTNPREAFREFILELSDDELSDDELSGDEQDDPEPKDAEYSEEEGTKDILEEDTEDLKAEDAVDLEQQVAKDLEEGTDGAMEEGALTEDLVEEGVEGKDLKEEDAQDPKKEVIQEDRTGQLTEPGREKDCVKVDQDGVTQVGTANSRKGNAEYSKIETIRGDASTGQSTESDTDMADASSLGGDSVDIMDLGE